jgi:hypothetical protein
MTGLFVLLWLDINGVEVVARVLFVRKIELRYQLVLCSTEEGGMKQMVWCCPKLRAAKLAMLVMIRSWRRSSYAKRVLRLARVVSHCNSSINTGVMASLPGRLPKCPGFRRVLSIQWCVRDLHFTPRRRFKSASYRYILDPT